MSINKFYLDSLSKTETICRRLTFAVGSPAALIFSILVQIIWITVGQITHKDAFPFAALLTFSNIIQLILIFVIAVGQKQANDHAELRTESTYNGINQILENQQKHLEELLEIKKSLQNE